jgi:hypothetical protein
MKGASPAVALLLMAGGGATGLAVDAFSFTDRTVNVAGP